MSDFRDLIVVIIFKRLVFRVRVRRVGVVVGVRFVVADVRRHRGRRAARVTVGSFLYRLGKKQFHLKQTIKCEPRRCRNADLWGTTPTCDSHRSCVETIQLLAPP